MQNSLTISAAAGEPYILVMGTGLWAPDHVEQHFRALERVLRAMRARCGFARVLVDLSDAMVQTIEAATVMNRWTDRIYRAQDEVAVICGTTLLAMQIRREAKIYHRGIFAARKPALAWLMADKADEGARALSPGA